MQNTVIELSHRLLRSLDSDYNVTDMPAVVEIISTLERTSITKELLETTRLGKYINELRRKTSNDSLAKRAKELLKRWRDQLLPSNNTASSCAPNGTSNVSVKSNIHNFSIDRSNSPDLNLNEINKSKKRPLSSLAVDDSNFDRKRVKLNGNHALSNEHIYISDNSNSSVKELANFSKQIPSKTEVIIVNSDSNSSCHDAGSDRIPKQNDPNLTFSGRNFSAENTGDSIPRIQTPSQQQPPPIKLEPKRRGRKKGSKNHKTLIVQAEESFTNKMAVSVNSKVKTTQELIASLKNKHLKPTVTNPIKCEKSMSSKTDKVALSVVSPKVNNENNVKSFSANSNSDSLKIFGSVKNQVNNCEITRNDVKFPTVKREESHGSFPASVKTENEDDNSKSSLGDVSVISGRASKLKKSPSDEEEVVEITRDKVKEEFKTTDVKKEPTIVKSDETVEEILAKLPAVDYSILDRPESEEDDPKCTCSRPDPVPGNENITIEFSESGSPRPREISIFDVPEVSLPEKGVRMDFTTRSPIAEEPSEVSVPEARIDPDCPAKRYYESKFRLDDDVSEERVEALHTRFLDSLNGNKCEKTVNSSFINCDENSDRNSELYSNIVPNFHAGERIKKDVNIESLIYLKNRTPCPLLDRLGDERTRTPCYDEVREKYVSGEQAISDRRSDFRHDDASDSGNAPVANETDQISSTVRKNEVSQRSGCGGDNPSENVTSDNFCEFHECVSLRSYNDEFLHILPYVVLD